MHEECVYSSRSSINTSKKSQDMSLDLEQFLTDYPVDEKSVVNISPSKDYGISKKHYQKFLTLNQEVKLDQVIAKGTNLATRLDEIGVPGGLALELGCGAGAGSRPIVSSGYFSRYLITDGSSDLAAITRESIESLGINASGSVSYATLLDSDLPQFPSSSVSAIFLFASLHHFIDWQETLRVCARVLEPGGIIFFTDPCLETNLILSTLFCAFESKYRAKHPFVRKRFFKPMHQLIAATKFRGNPHAPDKERFEDKHFFQIRDMYQFAQEEGLRFRHFPNANVGNFSVEGVPPKIPFRPFIRGILSNSQHFPDDLIEAFISEMEQPLDLLEYFWSAGQGPISQFTGIMQNG
jgi:ubiquinone/menaquinone biosynthesis C-methylase UbiE